MHYTVVVFFMLWTQLERQSVNGGERLDSEL
jgi:hypothetical protein